MLALLIGLALLVLLPRPWNGVGFAAAAACTIVGLLLGLRWSRRQAPTTGPSLLVGQRAVVVETWRPWVLVRVRGETWRARSRTAVEPGDRVRVCSVDGLTLRIEPDETA